MPRARAYTRRTPEKERAFLGALGQGLSVTGACEAAEIGRTRVYEWRREDTAFAGAWDEAVEAGTDYLEDEAKRRAAEGVDEPVFYQGVICGKLRKYSDTLLIFLLKARRPEKYRERSNVELTGHAGGPVEIDDRAAAARIAALLTAARSRRDDDGTGSQ